MVKKIIIFGEINKKHILPLSLAIYQVFNKIFNTYYPKNILNGIFELYSMALGMLSILFLPCIFKIKVTDRKRKEKFIKGNGYIILY